MWFCEGNIDNSANEAAPLKKFNYICIKVNSAKKDKVDMRIPLGLLRAGMKFTSLMPPNVMDKINSTMQEQGLPAVGVDIQDIQDIQDEFNS